MTSRASRAAAVSAPSSVLKAIFDHSTTTRSLVVLQDGFVQSSTNVIREILARGGQLGAVVILVSALRRPRIYTSQLPGGAKVAQEGRLIVLDGSGWVRGYGSIGGSLKDNGRKDAQTFETLDDLRDKLLTALRTVSPGKRVTVILDSLDELADRASNGPHETITLVREILSSLNAFSRLFVGLKQSHPAPSSAKLFAQLCSPSIWTVLLSSSSSGGGSGGGTTTIVRILPAGLIAHVLTTYGLRPPSTSADVAASLLSEEGLVAGQVQPSSVDAGPSSRTRRTAEDYHNARDESSSSTPSPTEPRTSPQDVKFWEILALLASRGDTSLSAGGNKISSELGWWTQDRSRGRVGLAEPLSSPNVSALGAQREGRPHLVLQDIVGVKQDEGNRRGKSTSMDSAGRGQGAGRALDLEAAGVGLVLLEARHRTATGKLEEEILGCVCTSSGRLRLLPLDMSDQSQSSGARASPSAPMTSASRASTGSSTSTSKSGASTSTSLPFNLGETEEQRARRAEVPLPYAYMQSQEPIMFDEGRMGIAPGAGGAHDALASSATAARRGHTGKSTILFEPESEDDEDEEDPDDDLDF